jgi:hypothetical protein
LPLSQKNSCCCPRLRRVNWKISWVHSLVLRILAEIEWASFGAGLGSSREPWRHSAISCVSFQFLARHPFECFRHRRVFKLDGLPGSPLGSISNLSSGLHVALYGIPNLSFGNQLGPRSSFRVVRDQFLELVPVGIGKCLALRPSRRIAALPLFRGDGLCFSWFRIATP